MRPALLTAGSIAYLTCLVPGAAWAHSFGTPYALPVPFWLYVYGSVATLVLTFALLAIFVNSPADRTHADESGSAAGVLLGVVSRRVLAWLRVLGLACLVLTIVAGMLGTQDAARNIGMSLFWVYFLLGFTYVALLLGDLYVRVNPWEMIADGVERIGISLSIARVRLRPNCVAVPLYFALAWIELFVPPQPVNLSIALLAYTMMNVAGAALWSRDVWFREAEVFSVMFRLISRLSPIEIAEARAGGDLQVRLRRPLEAALCERPARSCSIVLILLMLSATTYDAIHGTTWWIGLFWKSLLRILQSVWGQDLGAAQSALMGWYLLYQRVGLLLMFAAYYALFLVTLLLMKVLARTSLSVNALAMSFGYTLLPIAIAYGIAHYAPLFAVQILAVPRLLADPFGFGWNLLGSSVDTIAPQSAMSVIWHLQVTVLVAGHLASAYLVHLVAVRTLGNHRSAIVGQLPILALMITYTIIGLWILSLPLGAE